MRLLSRAVLATFASPAGVLVLAALDSTVFFSWPFGIDTVVIVLAARRQSLAWIVPLLAVAGSLAGAALTFWMGREIGDKGLSRYIPARRLDRVRVRVRSSGAIALGALDLIPPPFPFTPFVLAAGALEVDPRLFFLTLAIARAIRFGVEAASRGTLRKVHSRLAGIASRRRHRVRLHPARRPVDHLVARQTVSL